MDENYNSENTQETVEGTVTESGANMEVNESEGVTERELTPDEFEEILRRERKKGTRRGVLLTLLFVAIAAVVVFAIVLIGEATGSGEKKTSGKYESLLDDDFKRKSDYLWAMVQGHFLWEDDIDSKAAQDEMYKAMVDSLGDKYSCYYTLDEFNEILESNNGEYSGIGAYISQNPDTMDLYISRPMPGSPAEEAGVKMDDYIYTVDGEDVTGQDINVVVSKIKGPEGTDVVIGFKHNNEGEIDEITITRRTIQVERLESEMLEDNIGYIWIYEFENNTDSQFKKAYNKLKDEGMEGLIIDLRSNPGGDVDIVCKIADMFLDEGVILETKNRNGDIERVKSDAECEKLPIVVLTDENSASASEILTGSLKDRGVATVVGKNTYGKGIVQYVYSLEDGTGLKITEAEYYLPNGECIHGEGIAPDVEVELDHDKYINDEIDTQKDKAVEVMKGLLKKQ